jgi:capsular polysaccharide transport system permease protein
MYQARSSLQVTLNVWHALFMREASARITGDRLGWSWLLLEPLAHVAILVALRQLMGRIRFIPGAEFVPWLIVGIMGFLLFRDAMNRSMNAITANRALFAYRQVLPIDTVIVRALLEGILKSVVFALILTFLIVIFEKPLVPTDAIAAAGIWFGIWALGLGFGLILSVLVTIVQELSKFVTMATLPLYFLSGVVIPVQLKPAAVQEYLVYNPLLHGLEALRAAFFGTYRVLPDISLLYLFAWALATIVFGLMLHIRFKSRLLAQ